LPIPKLISLGSIGCSAQRLPIDGQIRDFERRIDTFYCMTWTVGFDAIHGSNIALMPELGRTTTRFN
jgi:hypothetical protein